MVNDSLVQNAFSTITMDSSSSSPPLSNTSTGSHSSFTCSSSSVKDTSLHPSCQTNDSNFPFLSIFDTSFDVLDTFCSSRAIFVSFVIDANRKGKNTWSLLKLVSIFIHFLLSFFCASYSIFFSF